ncbi:MAG: hypothetical protein Q9173_006207 [Seirophora scorigena]
MAQHLVMPRRQEVERSICRETVSRPGVEDDSLGEGWKDNRVMKAFSLTCFPPHGCLVIVRAGGKDGMILDVAAQSVTEPVLRTTVSLVGAPAQATAVAVGQRGEQEKRVSLRRKPCRQAGAKDCRGTSTSQQGAAPPPGAARSTRFSQVPQALCESATRTARKASLQEQRQIESFAHNYAPIPSFTVFFVEGFVAFHEKSVLLAIYALITGAIAAIHTVAVVKT